MKVLVLGIGNILFGDEGIGVHLCNYLKLNYHFEFLSGCVDSSIDFVDGGTLGPSLIPLIVSYDRVLILDTVDVPNSKVGDVYSFPFSAVPKTVTWAGSAHEVEMLQTLRLVQAMGDLPHVHIIGIVPSTLLGDTTFQMSEDLLKGAKHMELEAIGYLLEIGISANQYRNLSLEFVANHSFRGVDEL